MFRLKNNGQNWELHTRDNGAREGSFEAIMDWAQSLGIALSELQEAVKEMAKNAHKYAEFGVRRRFMFTSNEIVVRSSK
jgi:hypothetical protein